MRLWSPSSLNQHRQTEAIMLLIDASSVFLSGWCDACEGMESDCSWELWCMGGEI